MRAAKGFGVVICALLIAAHLLVVHEGPGWTSPVLLGDHLFDLLLAATLFLYSAGAGPEAERPLGRVGA